MAEEDQLKMREAILFQKKVTVAKTQNLRQKWFTAWIVVGFSSR